MIDLRHGDCLEVMATLPDASVDMILCDLPYGTTACKWDFVIPFEPLWAQYRRIAKRNAAIVLTASQPFTTALIMSNMKQFRYCWIYQKNNPTGFLDAQRRPLNDYEDVCVFYSDLSEQRGAAAEYATLREYFQSEMRASGLSHSQIRAVLGNFMASHYFTDGVQFCIPSEENYRKLQSTGFFRRPYGEIVSEYQALSKSILPVTYNPQGVAIRKTKKTKKATEVYGAFGSEYETTGTNYPRRVIQFNRPSKAIHPTQKPVALMEYMIRTYTNEGETVLDNCMGSGTTGVACVNTGRQFIGIERDDRYFAIAQDRIARAQMSAAA